MVVVYGGVNVSFVTEPFNAIPNVNKNIQLVKKMSSQDK